MRDSRPFIERFGAAKVSITMESLAEESGVAYATVVSVLKGNNYRESNLLKMEDGLNRLLERRIKADTENLNASKQGVIHGESE